MNRYEWQLEGWPKNEWMEYRTDDGYHAAAERLVEAYDHRVAEYPAERVIWLRDFKHDTARRFVVEAEAVREYSAREE